MNYYELLEPLEKKGILRRPSGSAGNNGNHHLFYVLLSSEAERNGLIDELKKHGILSVFHYVPLHLSQSGRDWDTAKGIFPLPSKRASGFCAFRCITN